MSLRLPIPHEALSRFCRAHGVRELAVFGSAVRADFRDDSDLDILIDLEPDARVGLVKLQRMRDELAEIWGRPVDLLTRDGLNPNIRDAVLEEAEIVHAQ